MEWALVGGLLMLLALMVRSRHRAEQAAKLSEEGSALDRGLYHLINDISRQ